MNRRHGFTLIELLIVVAIIGILAAIAVPNFLNAQTRAAIARVKADFKSITTAMESYRLDNNNYPPDVAGPNDETKSYKVLTTPVAYMSSVEVFRDFFTAKSGRVDESGRARNYYDYGGGNRLYDEANVGYIVISFGPDRALQYPWGLPALNLLGTRDPRSGPFLYDGSNGLKSAGDLIVTGQGIHNR